MGVNVISLFCGTLMSKNCPSLYHIVPGERIASEAMFVSYDLFLLWPQLIGLGWPGSGLIGFSGEIKPSTPETKCGSVLISSFQCTSPSK